MKKHRFDFDGSAFSQSYLDGGPKIFESLDAYKKAKEKGRERFWKILLIVIGIVALLICFGKWV